MTANADSFYFLADYHALIKCDDPLRIQRSRLEIAATWLAGGLDVDRVTFYRQSDIPEIPELTWLLTCVAAKGLLNRAHAYKASVDKNVETGEDPDAGITMGLYSYPVLMAADILMFNAHKVPVGRDQIQHVEMARDIGQRFNHLFGQRQRVLHHARGVDRGKRRHLAGPGRPQDVQELRQHHPVVHQRQGHEGRDLADRHRLRARPAKPRTRTTRTCSPSIQAFATPAQADEFRSELLQGLGWARRRIVCSSCWTANWAKPRERYHQLMARPADMEDILLARRAKRPAQWPHRS